MSPDDNPHTLLGRIRFLNKCIECFRKSEALPESLCYVPKEVCYKICKDSSSGSASASSSTAGNSGGKSVVSVWESPHQAPHKKLCKCNIEPKKGTCIRTTGEEYCNSHGLWVKISKEQLEDYRAGLALDIEEGWILVCKHTEGGDRLVPVESPDTVSRQQQLFGYDHKPCSRWEQVMDVENSLHMGAKPKVAEPDEVAVRKLRYVPPTWTFECDEDLVHYFYDHIGKEDENLGSVKQCVTSIDVSSSSEDPSGGASCLTDGDTETFWESDGMQGQHWIRLHMKRGTVVNKLILTVDSTDDNYMPKRVTVYGGEGDNLKKYSDVSIDELRLGTFNQIKSIKQFLLLSKRRSALITQSLKDSETSKPNFMPRLYINRRLAMEHRDNPTLDPTCKNAVFTQVYEGLKPSDKYEKTLDYRWPARYDQWWECKFIAEGIIDQGGGFRDSLADMSEELCPSSSECPMPLPFFTRTSNQGAGEARDFYVPNPSCREFHKFEWIGQLMGAALRGKDFLVLALPGLVWKQLIGEAVSWTKDFPAVDSVLVKLLEAMEHMDKETFDFKFGQELVYTTPLSDGRLVELIPGGSGVVVRYEDRMEFICLVQKSRLEESREQIAAMQAGLVKVVPQAVLDLLTWQEVEKKVCGDPEITVEALKRLTRYEDLEQTDVRVQYLWEALMNFTNEDRSRFLRFVTGRSRLPAPIYIFPDKQGSETTDALPQSSTCSSTLYLPKYPSAKVCEEKLRYAAYNCVAIDTDMSPWEE
ncbi:E3 ubiquitin-protein ligase HECTD3 [Sinocyclocheilus rhinocerous]|uniref:E3 ubiquitin-protein ligase HECTD3 n=1 Tax=Sinocyclocheilus rhinocerous TaxID=307959 RepID=UPI0007B824EC|nr:PREDICTED: E3 ubiquitin-protein ligase HECTD3-like [Sinocyclocheilus rhinocerous]